MSFLQQSAVDMEAERQHLTVTDNAFYYVILTFSFLFFVINLFKFNVITNNNDFEKDTIKFIIQFLCATHLCEVYCLSSTINSETSYKLWNV